MRMYAGKRRSLPATIVTIFSHITRYVSVFVKYDTLFVFFWKLPQFHTSNFRKVVRQHTEGMVGSIIWVWLQIYLAFQQWKNFENPLGIDTVIAMSMVYYFFQDSVEALVISRLPIHCWLKTVVLQLLSTVCCIASLYEIVCRTEILAKFSIFTNFNMAAVRHLGFVVGGHGTNIILWMSRQLYCIPAWCLYEYMNIFMCLGLLVNASDTRTMPPCVSGTTG